jgi:hypothetical protein
LKPASLSIEFLLLLNEYAARAAAGENAVLAHRAFDAEFLTHVAPLHHRKDPSQTTAVGEDEETALLDADDRD